MKLNQIRISNFVNHLKERYNSSVNKFAKANNINVNAYYAILRGERPFGDRIARKVEKLLGLEFWELDKLPDENIRTARYYPLIIDGEPIPAEPIKSKLKRKVYSDEVNQKLLDQLGLRESDIFIAEFKSTLFYPMINPYGNTIVLECPTNEDNDTVRSIIGRFRYGIIVGMI